MNCEALGRLGEARLALDSNASTPRDMISENSTPFLWPSLAVSEQSLRQLVKLDGWHPTMPPCRRSHSITAPALLHAKCFEFLEGTASRAAAVPLCWKALDAWRGLRQERKEGKRKSSLQLCGRHIIGVARPWTHWKTSPGNLPKSKMLLRLCGTCFLVTSPHSACSS